MRTWAEWNSKIFNTEKKQNKIIYTIQKKTKKKNKERKKPKTPVCVYCEKEEHRYVECNSIRKVANCTRCRHRVLEGKKTKHASIVRDNTTSRYGKKMTNILLTKNHTSVTYPALVVEVEKVKYQTFIDTGAVINKK